MNNLGRELNTKGDELKGASAANDAYRCMNVTSDKVALVGDNKLLTSSCARWSSVESVEQLKKKIAGEQNSMERLQMTLWMRS